MIRRNYHHFIIRRQVEMNNNKKYQNIWKSFLLLGVIFLLIPSIMITTVGFQGGGESNNEINSIIHYSTYLGGAENDRSSGVFIDSMGNPILVGQTKSSDFPIIKGNSTKGGLDIFLTKFNGENLSEVVYSTTVGGTDNERFRAAAIDTEDNIYVVGYTTSNDLPTTAEVYSPDFNGGDRDGFVAKFAPNGSLTFITYLGGLGLDVIKCVDIDSMGDVWVGGVSQSPDFPTTVDGFDLSYNGGTTTDAGYVDRNGGDGVYTKLSANGSVLLYSSFLGGSDNEQLVNLKIDSSDNVYLSGFTKSSDFPTTTGAWSTSHQGERDLFVTKFADDGITMNYSTLIGGGWDEEPYGTWIDSDGYYYLSGWTESGTFPTTEKAIQTSRSGPTDCFMLKLSPTGNDLIFSSYIGGSDPYESWWLGGWETYSSMAIDPDTSDIYQVGCTTNGDYPTTDKSHYNGGYFDMILTVFSAGGSRIRYSTFIGGSEGEGWPVIALASSKVFFVGTFTESSDHPVTEDAFDTSASNEEAVLMKIVLPETFPSPPVPGYEYWVTILFLALVGVYSRKRKR
jgi:hypothetical protein